MKLLAILLKHKIYDDANFMKYRENLYKYVEKLSKIDNIDNMIKNELYYDLLQITKQNYEKDLFSELFMELGTNTKGMKQLFTPHSISDLLGKIATSEEVGSLIYEPTCGTGANIFPVMGKWCQQETIVKMLNKKEYQKHLVIAQDLDPINCAITALNCSLRGINAIVMNMDTLENSEVLEGYLVFNVNGIGGISIIKKISDSKEKEELYKFWIDNFFKNKTKKMQQTLF